MRFDKLSIFTVALLAGVGLGAVSATAQDPAFDARADLVDRDGETVGDVVLRQMPNGTLLEVRLDGLQSGVHGFHVHETGACEPPFDSAGGHYNPEDAEHGFATEGGPHAGDLPNVHVPDSGRIEVEMFTSFLTLDDRLFDADGAAIIVHEGVDDYISQPSGAAGDRIACGVIEQR